MLREQLFDFAINALMRAHETKEQIKRNLKSEIVQNYVQGLKQAAIKIIEKGLNQHREQSEHLRKKPNRSGEAYKGKKAAAAGNNLDQKKRKYTLKRPRKSSIRQAKEIHSERAETILSMLNGETKDLVKVSEELTAKKSLSCLIWALGQAKRAELSHGISIHDISALLYKAHAINLYPINISRVVHSNETLVQQAGQDQRTKTYLLTDAGTKVFKEKFLKG